MVFAVIQEIRVVNIHVLATSTGETFTVLVKLQDPINVQSADGFDTTVSFGAGLVHRHVHHGEVLRVELGDGFRGQLDVWFGTDTLDLLLPNRFAHRS